MRALDAGRDPSESEVRQVMEMVDDNKVRSTRTSGSGRHTHAHELACSMPVWARATCGRGRHLSQQRVGMLLPRVRMCWWVMVCAGVC